MRTPSRFLVLGAVVVAGIGAWSAYWLSVAHAIIPGIERWAADERAKGREVELGAMRVEGYPFRIVVRVPRFVYAAPAEKGAPRYETEGLTLVAQPYNLRHVIARADNAQKVSWRDGGGAAHAATIVAARAFASVVADRETVERIAIDLDSPSITTDSLAAPLTARRLQIHARRPDPAEATPAATGTSPTAPPLVELAIDSTDVSSSALPGKFFANGISEFDLTLGLTGAIPAGSAREAAVAWRDAGGTLEVTRLVARIGQLDASGAGTFALDEALRPLGAFSFRVANWEAALDAAVADGQMEKRAADTAKTTLGLLSLGAKDAEGRLAIPLTLQGGQVLLGPIPVGKVAPLF